MLREVLGGIGIGLVWGWWAGSSLAAPSRPLWTGAWQAAGTAALLAISVWLGERAAAIALLAAALFALTARLLWRRSLLHRYAPETFP